MLRNESARVGDDTGELWIAGIDDALLGSPDPQRAFASVPPGARAVALWHEPDWAEHSGPAWGLRCSSRATVTGVKSGCPLPARLRRLQGGRRFVQGLNFAAGMPVYTTRGVGVYRPPVRFRCPPEVTLVTLV